MIRLFDSIDTFSRRAMFYAIAKECESLYVKVCQRLSANDREYALGFSRARLRSEVTVVDGSSVCPRKISSADLVFDAGFGFVDCILATNSSK